MQPSQRLLLKAGHLLCGKEFQVKKDMAVMIEDGIIKEIMPYEHVPQGHGAQPVDGSALFLLPGLIDAHNHLSLDASLPAYLEKMTDPLPALVLRAAKNIEKDVLAGVTTMRCLGDKEYLDAHCRNFINSGFYKGPRLVLSGKGIRSSAGHGFVGYPCDGPEAIRLAVRDNIRQGADIVKFFVTGTLPSKGGMTCFLSREEIEMIVSEANRMGRPTAVHCVGGVGFDWCLDAGVDVIEHGYFLTEKQIDRLSGSRVRLVMTPGFYMADQRIQAMPGPLVEPHRAAAGMARSTMEAIIRSGIPYALGTDGVHGSGAMAAEMACLTALGASPRAALSAATTCGAEVCGLEGVTGRIEIGMSADLIGVEANPLENMDTLTDIRCVIARGKVVKP